MIKNYQLQIIHYLYERVETYSNIDQNKKDGYQNKDDLDFKRYERRIAKAVMSSFIQTRATAGNHSRANIRIAIMTEL